VTLRMRTSNEVTARLDK